MRADLTVFSRVGWDGFERERFIVRVDWEMFVRTSDMADLKVFVLASGMTDLKVFVCLSGRAD